MKLNFVDESAIGLESGSVGLADLAGLVRQKLQQSELRRYVVVAISLAVLAASLTQLATVDIERTFAILPSSPGFWLLFAGYYLTGPAADWVIFRRLWALPIRGLGALLRKTISNEVLLGYSGEVYFYAWARRHMRLCGTPFGAIKDVAILSAAAGNVATLVLFMVAWPLLPELHAGLESRLVTGSIVMVTIGPVLMLLLGDRLFTLRPNELRFVGTVHVARIVASMLLVALVWRYLIPTAPLQWWVLLATLRMLVSRLPFIPNKDIAFAAVAALAVGSQTAVADMLALVAALVIGTHILLGAILFLIDLLKTEGGDVGADTEVIA